MRDCRFKTMCTDDKFKGKQKKKISRKLVLPVNVRRAV